MIPDHRYIQGQSLPKLHGVLVAAMGVGPAVSDRWRHFSEATVIAHQAHVARAASKRLWIEIGPLLDLGGHVFYISLDPGEYRRERPSSPADMIVAASPIKPGPSWREQIAEVADQAAADEFFASETLTLLIAQAHGVMEASQPGRVSFASMACRLNTLIADADGGGIDPEVFQSLYQEAVPGFQLPARDFATAELLLRAQLGLGFRFDCEITGISADALTRFLASQKPGFVDGFVEFLGEMGRMTLSNGKVSVREALTQSTVYEFQRRLLHAVYCYSVAMYAATVADGLGRASRLSYKPLVAEESWVCTMTGLFYGAKLALEGYETVVDEIRLEIQANRVEAAYRVAHRYSSEIFPILPEAVLDVFVARALIERRGEFLQEGIQKLETLWREQQWSLHVDYERSLVENGLLDGYKAVGDKPKAKEMATRIAGRMVVGRALKIDANGETSE